MKTILSAAILGFITLSSANSEAVVVCGQDKFWRANCEYQKPGTNEYYATIRFDSPLNPTDNVYTQNPTCIQYCNVKNAKACRLWPEQRGASSKDHNYTVPGSITVRRLYCSTTAGRWLHVGPTYSQAYP